MPDELWTKAPDILQETGIKTIPKKKKCKSTKWLSEEALRVAVKTREAKSKREKERYTHLNAEFQRTTRRDKKAFFSDHCKELEENNRIGKTRNLYKKIRDTKGTFHAKMGSLKDNIGMDLIEAEEIKMRWQEYTEELYKKDLHDPDNHDGVITHQEPDILEPEVKWALESITTNKASGGDGIPAKLFQIPKDAPISATLNMSANLENSAVATGLEKVRFHSSPKEGQCERMFKLAHNCTHLTRQQNNAQNSSS